MIEVLVLLLWTLAMLAIGAGGYHLWRQRQDRLRTKATMDRIRYERLKKLEAQMAAVISAVGELGKQQHSAQQRERARQAVAVDRTKGIVA